MIIVAVIVVLVCLCVSSCTAGGLTGISLFNINIKRQGPGPVKFDPSMCTRGNQNECEDGKKTWIQYDSSGVEIGRLSGGNLFKDTDGSAKLRKVSGSIFTPSGKVDICRNSFGWVVNLRLPDNMSDAEKKNIKLVDNIGVSLNDSWCASKELDFAPPDATQPCRDSPLICK